MKESFTHYLLWNNTTALEQTWPHSTSAAPMVGPEGIGIGKCCAREELAREKTHFVPDVAWVLSARPFAVPSTKSTQLPRLRPSSNQSSGPFLLRKDEH